MVTRNDDGVTCHLPGLDQRDRRAGANGNLDDITLDGVALQWLPLPKNR
jgi:hypothetical protein